MKTKSAAFVVGAALLSISLPGCGPAPGKEAEETATALAEIFIKRWPDALKKQIEMEEYSLECDKKAMEWFSNRGAMRKRIDEGEAKLDFRKDNLGKCKAATFEIARTEKLKDEKGNERIKQVTVNFWGYVVKNLNPKSFYLELVEIPLAIPEGGNLVEADGKWKLHNKKEEKK